MSRSTLRVGLALGILAAPIGLLSGADASEPVRVTAADGPDREAKQPQVAVDARGRIYIAFGRGNTVRLASSTDGGRTYDVNTVGDGRLARARHAPRAARRRHGRFDRRHRHRGARREGARRRCPRLALGGRGEDLGRADPGECGRRLRPRGPPRHGRRPRGRVFCTWLDLRNEKMEVYGALSKDGGATWEPDALVYRSPDGSVCECCHPSAAFGPDGTLHVMWRNSLKGARDLYLANSSDGGKTFGAAEKLGRGTWPLEGLPDGRRGGRRGARRASRDGLDAGGRDVRREAGRAGARARSRGPGLDRVRRRRPVFGLARDAARKAPRPDTRRPVADDPRGTSRPTRWSPPPRTAVAPWSWRGRRRMRAGSSPSCSPRRGRMPLADRIAPTTGSMPGSRASGGCGRGAIRGPRVLAVERIFREMTSRPRP